MEPTLPLIALLMLILYFGVVVGGSMWHHVLERQFLEKLESDGDLEPAIEGDIDLEKLRNEPTELEQLREKVRHIGIVSAPGAVAEDGGGGVIAHYEAFVVDSEGVPHTFFTSQKWEEAQHHAQWLADRLDIPVEDTSYGG